MMFFHTVELLVLLMIFILKSNSFESTLRLYDSFAEIHQEYNGPIHFEQSDWDNIKHESIMLRSTSDIDVNETSMFERRAVRITMNMTGKTVFVRRYQEQKYPILCEIIHEENSYTLVREIESGHYFRTSNNLIEYSDEPQNIPIYEVSFHPVPINRSLIVSYVIKNLRWQTRYTLQTYSDRPTQFQILVDVINSSPSKYQFEQIHLMSGDINLSFSPSRSSPLIMAQTSSSQDRTDYSGISLFSSINKSLNIEPYSILTVPIRSPNIQIETIFIYTLVLTMPEISSKDVVLIDSRKDKFQRLYQLSNSSSFLPTGHLLLYDSSANVLTGEWYLPTLVELEKYEFKLGEDPDVILIYNRTTNINQKTNSSLITTNVLIQNYKQQNIRVRFKSICELSLVCLFYDEKARSLGSRLRYELYLKPKSEVVFSFTSIRLF